MRTPSSDEEDLHRCGEGRDGREEVFLECLLQMSQRELCRAVRNDLRRLAQTGQRSSDSGLSFGKTFPETIGGRLALPAFELSKGVDFIAGAYSLLEKLPQGIGGEKAVLDFIGHPNAECTATAGGKISVGAEDASCTYVFFPWVIRIVSAKESMLDEIANGLAMAAGRDFELGIQIIEFDFGRANPTKHDNLTA